MRSICIDPSASEPAMSEPVPRVSLLIDGEFVVSDSSHWQDVVNPADQSVLAQVPFATTAEVDAAVAAASRAFVSWRKTPIGTRARVFLKYQQLIRGAMPELAALLSAEQGKTLADAEGDVFRGLEVVGAPRRSAICSWASWPITSPTAWTPTACCSRWACALASPRSTSRR